MKVKNYDYPDHKTARQWAQEGFLPKENVEGIKLWSNQFCQHCYIYYSINDVEKADKAKLDAFFAPERARKNEAAKKKREKQRKINREIEFRKACRREPKKMIVIDTETTGLNPFNDELLQISIISGDGETLYNSYIKPHAASWKDAERIHGISPAMVENAPSIEKEMPKINALICNAKVIVGYNIHFDLEFLRHNGLILSEDVVNVDVMKIFAEIYGEYSEYFDDYKWQKLTTAADYYNYDWSAHGSAHNSLADCYATLYVYNHLDY